MFEWLASTPLWFQIIFAALGFIAVIISLITIIKKGVFFSKNKWGFDLNVGANKKPRIIPHSNCPYVKDVLILLTEIIRLSNERYHLTEKIKIKNQMNYADQKLEQIRALISKEYNLCLQETTTQTIKLEENVHMFRLILREAQALVRDLLRSSFSDNGFDSISEKEFDIFFDDKWEYLISQYVEFIGDNYFYEGYVSHEELKQLLEKNKHKIKDMFKDIYIHAREVAVEINIKILEINERIDNAITHTLGISCGVK